MRVIDLGTMPYREAWAAQERAHAEVLAGAQERVILVEHPPVITYGRRPGVEQHVITSEEQLQKMGVEVVQSDRGGDVTFHGPGQLVVYPIVRLSDHWLSVGGFVRRLEMTIIAALKSMGIEAGKSPDAIGVWVPQADGSLAKICALGVRIRRGVSMHGVALNVTTDLRYFELIVPCGLPGGAVTSLATLLGEGAPTMEQVKRIVADEFLRAFDRGTSGGGESSRSLHLSPDQTTPTIES